jgi:hypothetical protein
VRYEVRVVSAASRFEIERDEPRVVGEMLRQFSMAYEVMRILPGEGDFDAVVEVEWRAGPELARVRTPKRVDPQAPGRAGASPGACTVPRSRCVSRAEGVGACRCMTTWT